jgi:hypothetical protein
MAIFSVGTWIELNGYILGMPLAVLGVIVIIDAVKV